MRAVLVALARRQRQHIVEHAELRVDLLAQVLLVAHELGERRILGGRARARSRQRLLHRAAANGIGQAEGFGRGIAAAAWRCAPAGRCRPRRDLSALLRAATVVVSSSSAFSRGAAIRIGGIASLEFAQRIGVASGAGIADRQRAARRSGVEMVFAGPRGLALDQRLRRFDSRFDLA